jgi:type I restriction enzyme, S subunit
MSEAVAPEPWMQVDLDSVIESAIDGPFGSHLKSEHYVDQPGVRVIRLQNIGVSRFLDNDHAYVSSAHAANLSRHSVRPGDLLVASLGDAAHPVARTCQYPDEIGPAIVKADCFRLRLDPTKARPEFVRWLLNSESARAALLQRAHGVTRDRVNLSSLRGLRITLPSLPEQRKIAEILDTADESIRSIERLIAKLYTQFVGLQAAIFNDANIKKVCASEVDMVPLVSAGRWLSGGTPNTSNPNYWGGVIPWISAASLHSFYIERSDRALTTEGSQNGTQVVSRGTVLFIVRGMSLKKEFRVGVTMRTVAFGQDCKAIIPNKGTSAQYLAHVLRAKESEVLRLVDEAGHGTGRLETRLLQNLPIPIPRRLEDQEELVQFIRASEDRLASEEHQLAKLRKIRRGLMEDLLTGRVRATVG